MNRRYRKTIIAGNWKMNMTASEAKTLIAELKPLVAKAKWCEIVLCVPFVDIPVAVRALKDSRIAVGAQNMHQAASGAYTGEVSASMLKDAGVKYVILGHSERRAYFGETDTLIAQKVAAALEAGLRPIICVGETLEQREQGITLELVTLQVKRPYPKPRLKNSAPSFLHMSRCGLLERAKPPHPNRPRKSAKRSGRACARCTARVWPVRLPFSTAVR